MKIMTFWLSETCHTISDADTTSVAILVMVESLSGNSQTAAYTHRIGLAEMIDARGGDQSFDRAPFILRLLAW
ncbi:hypothetical protein WAI453_002769 [Rhynchosporium graminicola]|uniref:Uncharacterized protein n=1 Tax=Rhynchosporium graminicola TaxID=2792576 RepID=A0A1E1JUQ1_9HELO|nr:uncharacterized protein RCO7_02490 [Rhynchosporium commune]